MPPIEPGQVIAGKYRVERVLGEGGMGVVLAAMHLELETRVALKLLLPHALGNESLRVRFLREARAAAKLKSEHVAQVVDVGRLESGEPFIVMEYLVGQDLARRVETGGPLPVREAIDLCMQTCEAIAEAHSVGIVHRDLKPANLFLTQGFGGAPCIKVLDFGISKTTDKAGDPGLTSTSAVMGSPYYMSPEQMQSAREADLRTDIWALGAILCELLTGRPPFNGESLPELILAIMQQPAPSLRALRPEIPAALEAVIFRCLEKDRERRYPDVASLSRALAPFGSALAQVSSARIAHLTGGSRAELLNAPAGSTGTVRIPPPEPGALLGRSSAASAAAAPALAASAEAAQTGGAWGATAGSLGAGPGRSRRTLRIAALAAVALVGLALGIAHFAGRASAPATASAAPSAAASPPAVAARLEPVAPPSASPAAPELAPAAAPSAVVSVTPAVAPAAAPAAPNAKPPSARRPGPAAATATPVSATPTPKAARPADLFSDRQ